MATTPTTPQGRNWLRFAELVVSSSGSNKGLLLSTRPQGQDRLSSGNPLRFRFEVRASDTDTPNNAAIRVYNLAPSTANTIVNEFDSVTLNAGYEQGAKGTIFKGTVLQWRRGKESSTDSYLDILAADGDLGRNFSVVNQSRPSGVTDIQQLSDFAAAMTVPVQKGAENVLTGGIIPSPRGKVAYGMTRDYMHDLARKNNCRWSIQGGVLTLIPNDSYLPGEAVVINSQTGMIGTPESTDNGITIRCYLNPLIQIGRLVQINEADISRTTFAIGNTQAQRGVPYASQYFPATTSKAGYYRVLVAEHVGDVRSNEWYTELTCLVANIDKNTVPTN